MYLEGSDQHRGWFQSSLLESCGTRGRAPFDIVLTHGFTQDEKGRKMSKSLGNTTAPEDVIRASGADILRLWTGSVDYTDDQRIGPEILKVVGDNYRKLRNTFRWMLGTLAHHEEKGDAVDLATMSELDRLMLHKLVELDGRVHEAYANFDFARVVAALTAFMNADLSAFYFDIRKDALYCDPPSSLRRRGALQAIEEIFRATSLWLAPILVFTMEEAWLARDPASRSVHLEQFPDIPAEWRDDPLAKGGRPSGRCVLLSRERLRSPAPRRRSARRSRPRRASTLIGPSILWRLMASTLPKSASPRTSQSRQGPRRMARSGCRNSPTSPSSSNGRPGSSAPAPGAISIRRLPTPISPT